MSLPRRFLPPMSELLAFEAAARLQSFTAAAAELKLTQSAVSRQIRALEDLLGGPLFIRERQTVRLNQAGAAYALEISEALNRVASATLSFRANPQGGSLNLAILPTFGTRWLAPRLPRFLEGHPGITINLSTQLAPFDFKNQTVDAAIHFGLPQWPGAELDFLMHEHVAPACCADFLATHAITRAQDLLDVPLLHLVSRPDAWEQWFQAQGVGAPKVHGMLVDQFAMAAQAAMAGLGVALLPRFLIEGELARGELVLAWNAPMQSTESYYLAWPSARRDYPPLQAFRGWIREQAGAVG